MKKGILVLILGITILTLMPFSIYADTWISPTYYDSSTQTKWNNAGGTVENFSEDPLTASTPSHLTFTFDDHYYGYVSFTGYYGGTSSYVSGTCFIADGQGIWNYRNVSNAPKKYIDAVRIDFVSLVIPDSSVDLTQIIQILTAIESDTTAIDSTLDTTLIVIQNVLSQLIISNGYLETLTEMRQWNFPIESFSAVMFMLQNNYELYGFHEFDYYTYPLFKVNSGDVVANAYINNNQTFTFICATNNNVYASTLDTNFSVDYGTLQNYTSLGRFMFNGFISYLFKFEVLNNSGTSRQINLTYNGRNNGFFMPIYFNVISNKYISTDFALSFGLTNSYLDNINIIANGTTQSNSASSGLEQQNTQMASDMNSLATIESGYNQDFNSQMQNIDFSNPITSNQGLLPAANFVITVFNGLINNNPLSVLIIICCILLIGRKVIGK